MLNSYDDSGSFSEHTVMNFWYTFRTVLFSRQIPELLKDPLSLTKIGKIHYMALNSYRCGAGIAADTEAVTDNISSQLKLHNFYHTDRESRDVTALIALLDSHLSSYQGYVSASWETLPAKGFKQNRAFVMRVSDDEMENEECNDDNDDVGSQALVVGTRFACDEDFRGKAIELVTLISNSSNPRSSIAMFAEKVPQTMDILLAELNRHSNFVSALEQEANVAMNIKVYIDSSKFLEEPDGQRMQSFFIIKRSCP
ncbi:hypothetical protein POM88_043236 [Heracleum sosnowskyi]|uniref:Uncharacterized protein n=1 Tax=Heracleum sosnowskyi TaxID=360622 RepID=A0AAD8H0M0_9APIA|nr:hypothetical protein POM88_043236 [Heracleum sosnowskyi]